MKSPADLPSFPLFTHIAVGILLATDDGQILDGNPAAQNLLGHTTMALQQLTLQQFIHPDDQTLDHPLQQALLAQQRKSYLIELRYRNASGQYAWGQFQVSRVAATPEQAAYQIIVLEDITERKQHQQRLLQEAFHDTLTGLPNRALFLQHLHQAFRHTLRTLDKRFAVLFLDLNRFKQVNDRYGHETGDILLIEFSRRVESCLRVSDVLARLSGDEFLILLPHIHGTQNAIHAAERIITALNTPFVINNQRLDVQASIGIALSTPQCQDPDDLIHQADMAMYQAKLNAYSAYSVYNDEMHHQVNALKQLKIDLEHALQQGDFQLYYQPIVALANQQIVGFESLVRWIHPEKGVILPADFIAMAEQVGMISQLDEWVIQTHCRQLKQWLQIPGFERLTISVNVSPRLFAQPDFIQRLETILTTTALPAQYLKLEITERAFMEKLDTLSDVLNGLRQRGIALMIDDFGTGHFALSCLSQYLIHTLKIDGSFITPLHHFQPAQEMVRAIINLAASFKIQVIAEKVETAQQVQALLDLDCQYGQGYYFYEPLNLSQTTALLSTTTTLADPEQNPTRIAPLAPDSAPLP